ncbi:MAG: hypothetical protein K6A44_06265 [bacterium]|nr:hypothetical protein [bacterium]
MTGVSNVTDNTGAYTGTGIAAGAVAGGASGYFLTKALKDNKATDKFVKAAAEGLEGEAKTAFEAAVNSAVKPELKTYLEGLKDATKTVVPAEEAALKTFKEGIVNTLKTHGLEGEAITKGLEGVTNAETLKTFVESASAQATHNAQKGVIDGLVKDGKFITEGANKSLGEGLQKVAKSFKIKAAAKWAGICAVALGIIAYLTSGPKNKA